MASTYTTNLGIEKIGTGEQSGTWGDTTNTNFDILDEAVNGIISITLSSAGSFGSPTALPITDGASSNGRNKFIELVDGGDLGGTAYVQLTPNDAEKIVHIRNSLSSSRSVIVFQGTYNASNDFEIVNGADVLLKFNGGGSGATVTDVNVDLTVTGATIATADINGGAIDGTVIGGASAAAITATTITGTTISASTAVVPDASDGATLGSTSLEWSDLYLADGAVVFFGDDQDITLTHVADTGLTLKHANTGDDKFPTFLLATGDTDIAADDKLGVINFQAPDEGAGTDATLVAAGIEAVSEGDFSASSNATSLVFKTGASEAAAEKMRVDSAGNVGINEASPLASLHINEGDIGSFTALNRQVAILERSSASFLSLLSGASSQAGIDFGDPDDVDAGSLRFDNNGNYFALRIADSEKLRLDSSGNLGVGTTSPTSKLHVSGSSGAGSRVHIQSTGAGLSSFDGSGPGLLMTTTGMNTSSKFTPAIQFGTTDTSFTTTNPKVGAAINGVASQSYSADDKGGMELAFHTTPNDPGTGQTTTERMRIDNSGLVGIGATDPVSQLEVQGSAPVVTANSNVFSSSGDGTGFGIYRSASGRTAGYTWSIENVISSGGSSSSDYQIDNLVFKGRASTSDSSLTERMRIDVDGNVGIGATSLSNKLTVNGNQVMLASGEMKFADAGNSLVSVIKNGGSGGTSQMQFLIGSTPAEVMRISSDGHVGIGDTSPDAGLTVHDNAGCVIATSNIARQTYTSVGTLQVSTSGSGGILIHSGSTSQGFLTFGDGAVAGRISYSHSTNDMTFLTGANTQMTLAQEGDLLLGTTTSTGNSGKFQAVRSDSGAIGFFKINNSSGAQNAVDIVNDANAAFVPLRFWVNDYGGSLVGSISSTTSSTAYNTSSDERLKENIVNAPAGNIDGIRVRSFDWKVDGSHQPYGMVAQELVDVAPEAVTQGKNEGDMWQIDYSKLVPMMIKEIQDLKAEVAALKGV